MPHKILSQDLHVAGKHNKLDFPRLEFGPTSVKQGLQSVVILRNKDGCARTLIGEMQLPVEGEFTRQRLESGLDRAVRQVKTRQSPLGANQKQARFVVDMFVRRMVPL